MSTEKLAPITIQTTVHASAAKAWSCYNDPDHVTQWNHASDDWHSPSATNDLRPGGEFHYLMAAKDGSFEFDFAGVYDEVIPEKKLSYTMADGRKVAVLFDSNGAETKVTTTFDPETQNTLELQRDGWQAILDNYKKHTEACQTT